MRNIVKQINAQKMEKLTLFCLIIVLYFGNSKGLDCKFEKPSSSFLSKILNEPQRDLGESFCAQYDVKKEINEEQFTECITQIMKYLSEVKESPESVKAYVAYCKNNNVRVDFCTNMIVYLKTYCWKMSDATRLLHFDGTHYEMTKLMYFTFKEVRITPEDWEKLQVGNLVIEECLQDLATEGVGSSGKNEMKTLLKYITNTKAISKCKCFELICLDRIQTSLSFKENILEEVCNNKDKDYIWSKRQLEAIAMTDLNSKEAKELGIDHKKIKEFLLTVGKEICEAEWQSSSQGTLWSFVFLIKQMQKDKQFDKESINLTIAALNARIGMEDYNELIDILAKQGETFKTMECRLNMIKKFLSVGCTREYNIANCNYEGYRKNQFNDHLKIMLEMKQQSDTCEKFLNDFIVVITVFYKSKWSPDQFHEVLASCKGKNNFIDCMKQK